MSKTKGNVIDPLEMCDEYGADAVRFALAVLSGTGRDLPFGTTRVAAYARLRDEGLERRPLRHRNARRGEARRGGDRLRVARHASTAGSSPGSRRPSAKVNDSLEVYRFDEAANALYAFFWTEFCDGYVEMVKPVLRDADVPGGREGEDAGRPPPRPPRLARAPPPLHAVHLVRDPRGAERRRGDAAGPAVPGGPTPTGTTRSPSRPSRRSARRRRGSGTSAPSAASPQTEALAAGLEVPDGPLAEALARARAAPRLPRPARLARRSRRRSTCRARSTTRSARSGLVVALPVKELGAEERAKLEKELAAVDREVEARRRSKLADEAFLSRAPPAVVEKNRKQLEELEERRARLAGNLAPAGRR